MEPQIPNTTPVLPAHTHTADEPESRAAAARIAPEMDALPEQDVEDLNLDVAAAVARVFATWETVQSYLPAMQRLETVDAARIAKLHDYAHNLIFWQGTTTYAAAAADALTPLADQGYAVRDRTLADLAVLAKHGVFSADLLAKFRGTNSHRKLGQDLIGLSNLVHERWDVIGGRSMITLEAMDEAMRLGAAILKGVGTREVSPLTTAQATVQRNKAYTLFSRAYDEARRALLFLRWHEGDADSILPSMYGTRHRAKKGDAEATPEAPAPAPTQPAQSSKLLSNEEEA